MLLKIIRCLIICLAEALEGGISDPRNPVIFKMFSLLNVGERAGSGLSNIQHAWEEQHWERPVLIENFEPERTTLKLKMENSINKITVNDGKATYNDGKVKYSDGKTTVNKIYNKTQEHIIELINKNSNITIKNIAALIGITER